LSLDTIGTSADAAGLGPRAGSSVTPVALAAPALPATQLSICLADEWSIQGLFNSLSATHLIQIAIIGGCIALYILFRAKGG
jgi:hypothetical protein